MLVSIAASLAVAAVIALIAFSILGGMNTELARIRVYDMIIGKSHALNILAGYLKEGSDRSDIRQVRGTRRSLDDLLGKITSQVPGEEALIKQLQRNSGELGPLIDQMFATGQGVDDGIERERRNVLASQVWMKVKFIADDTDRLKDISDSMIISAQGKTGATVIALIIILALTNGIIYFLSGRSIVRGQEALRASEERFRVTLSSIGDAVIATDASGLVTFFNPVAAKLTGWEPGEALHQPIRNVFSIINEKTRKPAEDIVKLVLREGNIVNLANHTALITRDGREIPIEDSAAPIKDSVGKIIGAVLVFHDVTEKRRAQEALRLTQASIDDSAEMVAWFTPDGKVRYANDATCRTLGYSRDELMTLTALDFSPGFTLEQYCEHWREVRQRKSFTLEVTHRRKDGSEYPAEVLVNHIEYGGQEYIFAYGRDITERKQMEEELHKAKEEAERHAKELEALMDAVPALIWVSRDTECLSMTGNRAVYEFLGMPGGANVSKTAPETERPVHFRALRNGMEIPLDELPMQRAAKGEGMQDYELEYAFDDGTSKITLGNTTPLYDSTGHVYGAIAAFMDITERKQAEKALRESKAKLQAALDSMTDAVFISDDEGRFIDFNDAFATFHRFRNKDECLKTLAEYPDILDVYMADGQLAPLDQWAVPRALRGETVTNAEYTLRRKDTGETWVGSYSFGPIRDKDGVIVGSVVVGRDVTELKRAEEALRASEERFRLLHEMMYTGVVYQDAEGKIVSMNPAAKRILGKTEEEFLGETSVSVEHHTIREDGSPFPGLEHPAMVTLRTGREVDGVVMGVFNPLEDVYRWIEINATPLFQEGEKIPYQVFTIFRDITEQRRLEKDLRKSRDELELRVRERTAELVRANEDLQRQAALLDLSHDAIFAVDSADVVSFWNKGAEDLYGFTREQAIGNVACEFLKTRFPESLEQVVNQAVDKGQWAGELRQTTSSAKEILVESRWALQRGTDGQPLGFLETNRDITAKKLAEEALGSNMARLELVNAELQEFAHVASHDLQEPLRKIHTFCDMARKRCAPALDTTSLEYLDRVIKSADRMRQLLRDLLDFSRVAARPEPFKKIDVTKIALEAADVFEASAKETGCKIEIENIPAIEADETQMLRLFQNLIGNALKFRGGETPKVKVHGKLVGRKICEILVEDNGIGFDPQFAELIFKPFQRLHSRSEYDGTGMGLAICRKIIERHGGNIRAESEQGKGSTFIIRLPVKQDRWEGI